METNKIGFLEKYNSEAKMIEISSDRVHFPSIDSPVYESKINANVWSPTAYPEGWLLIP